MGKFITEDPIKDGVNWYVYCANNPLNRTDPTGLREIEISRRDDEEKDRAERREKLDRQKSLDRKEKEIKEDFQYKYMKDAILSDDEIDIYHELLSIQKNIDAIDKIISSSDDLDLRDVIKLYKELDELSNTYDLKLLKSLHLQTEESMIPDGAAACLYRSIQAGIELGFKKPLPMSMINDASQFNIDNEDLETNYFVNDMESIANDILNRLGYPHLESLRENNDESVFKYSTRHGRSVTNMHFNLGDPDGKFKWDPYHQLTNYVKDDEVDNLRIISIVHRNLEASEIANQIIRLGK